MKGPASWLIGILVFASTPALAQPFDTTIEPSSPAWWTLSDQLSPDDLRSAFVDRDESETRLQASIARGLQTPSAAGQQVLFYLNPAETPELVPLWDALSELMLSIESTAPELIQRQLSEYALTERSQDVLLESFGSAYRQLFAERSALISRPQIELQKMVRKRAEALPPDERVRALNDAWHLMKGRDTEALAAELGLSEHRASELMAAWWRDPRLEAAVELLPGLRSELGLDDWDRLKRFLRERIAPEIGSYLEYTDGGIAVE